MAHFDEDARYLVDVHIVHGFCQIDDGNLAKLERKAAAYGNIMLHAASVEPTWDVSGVHHAKMMILFRYDDMAQIVIHTANMTSQDWNDTRNMIWCSPWLPRLVQPPPGCQAYAEPAAAVGLAFQADLMEYLRAYNECAGTLGTLPGRLGAYDFSAVRAALVASVPGRYRVNGPRRGRWGLLGLAQQLCRVEVAPGDSDVVVQVPSIATLGSKDTWLKGCLHAALAATATAREHVPGAPEPSLKILFPTADDIRRSVGGYGAGAGILTTLSTPQHTKQLAYLRPLLHRWGAGILDSQASAHGDAARPWTGLGRRPICHAKTYVRRAQGGNIEWALMTSADLSRQAWGHPPSGARGKMYLPSWELGVLIWPSMFGRNAQMAATTNADLPSQSGPGSPDVLVGVRLPYTTPLCPYEADDIPWIASRDYDKPDCLGQWWRGRS
ncbi:tyrosyl-DNA phosphodiesterase [Colletotrichum melonis]|uniref:Tyrosyl-DNA phosphodiesterase n=1 Tax=Colletotrichum melonis TaxID=1209925 RepID=A0AAI9U6C5_9PEZI|nr:tyrosyl-DNA phosphodiesterase [Colletotrichum melonis]